jgi:hypothetical protein
LHHRVYAAGAAVKATATVPDRVAPAGGGMQARVRHPVSGVHAARVAA